MNDKKEKMLYWMFTVPFCLMFLGSGLAFLAGVPRVVQMITELGYPAYVLKIIGAAKLLGVAAVVTGLSPRLKEWAYAGFTINMVGALASHALHGDALGHTLSPLIPLALVICSYAYWKKEVAS